MFHTRLAVHPRRSNHQGSREHHDPPAPTAAIGTPPPVQDTAEHHYTGTAPDNVRPGYTIRKALS